MKPKAHNVLSYSVALLVFVAVLAFRRAFGAVAAIGPVAALASVMWCAHFARRAAESAWVHRYGKAKVPLADVLIEYVYYWGFAAWNAVSLSSPGYRAPTWWLVLLGVIVFALSETGNAKAHRMLRDLRPAGSKLRRIPRGFLFERVSCPHYTFEISSWLGFALVTGTWAARAFLLVGAGILASWAHTRHRLYRRDFDGHAGRELYPSSRRALIPWLF